jgi:glucose-6-phosphate 1-dehydrogenase
MWIMCRSPWLSRKAWKVLAAVITTHPGALRDVLQNHVLQLLCLIAMDPPSLFQAREIRDEKLKVLQALRPGSAGAVSTWAVRGQYAAGLVGRQPALAYREEDRVSPASNRETFVAMKVLIDNWRWAGVPFFLPPANACHGS